MKNNFDEYESDRLSKDPNNYKYGIFYFNRKDGRVMVPKYNKGLGWTLNFGNIYSYFIILGIVAAFLIATRLG